MGCPDPGAGARGRGLGAGARDRGRQLWTQIGVRVLEPEDRARGWGGEWLGQGLGTGSGTGAGDRDRDKGWGQGPGQGLGAGTRPLAGWWSTSGWPISNSVERALKQCAACHGGGGADLLGICCAERLPPLLLTAHPCCPELAVVLHFPRAAFPRVLSAPSQSAAHLPTHGLGATPTPTPARGFPGQ